jgi:hypothetical protein
MFTDLGSAKFVYISVQTSESCQKELQFKFNVEKVKTIENITTTFFTIDHFVQVNISGFIKFICTCFNRRAKRRNPDYFLKMLMVVKQ